MIWSLFVVTYLTSNKLNGIILPVFECCSFCSFTLTYNFGLFIYKTNTAAMMEFAQSLLVFIPLYKITAELMSSVLVCIDRVHLLKSRRPTGVSVELCCVLICGDDFTFVSPSSSISPHFCGPPGSGLWLCCCLDDVTDSCLWSRSTSL